LVEHRSPKPRVVGSSPPTPASFLYHHRLSVPARAWAVFLLFLMTGLWPAAAQADQVWHAGQLICEGNRALVRFGVVVHDDPAAFPPLPDGIAPFQAAQVDGNTCILADGREVKVKIGGRAPRPYGQCGAAANSFASLWVDGRKVLSRQWVLQSCFSDGQFDIFVVDGASLTLCRSEQSNEGIIGGLRPAGCEDASDRLNMAMHDWVEYPVRGQVRREMFAVEIVRNSQPEICDAFLSADVGREMDLPFALRVAGYPGTHHVDAQMQRYRPGWSAALDANDALGALPNFVWPTSAEVPDDDPDDLVGNGSDAAQFYAPFDFDNDGAVDLVIKASDDTHYFDGDMFFVTTSANRERLMRLGDVLTVDVGDGISLLENGVTTRLDAQFRYFGGLPDFAPDYRDRYTYQQVFRMDGETMVFATPGNREVRPSAVIYKPLAGGRAEPVCVFQRVEENY
jgi:hypothetical protein